MNIGQHTRRTGRNATLDIVAHPEKTLKLDVFRSVEPYVTLITHTFAPKVLVYVVVDV